MLNSFLCRKVDVVADETGSLSFESGNVCSRLVRDRKGAADNNRRLFFVSGTSHITIYIRKTQSKQQRTIIYLLDPSSISFPRTRAC